MKDVNKLDVFKMVEVMIGKEDVKGALREATSEIIHKYPDAATLFHTATASFKELLDSDSSVIAFVLVMKALDEANKDEEEPDEQRTLQ